MIKAIRERLEATKKRSRTSMNLLGSAQKAENQRLRIIFDLHAPEDIGWLLKRVAELEGQVGKLQISIFRAMGYTEAEAIENIEQMKRGVADMKAGRVIPLSEVWKMLGLEETSSDKGGTSNDK